jgi:tripartite ATP-independent transporter DctM subunit
VIGGIYLGVFTPIEAAGIGAFFAFIIFALAAKGLRQKFTEVLLETCKTTAMVVLIIIGAAIFNYFLAVTRLPAEIANIVANLHVSRHIVLAVIVIVYLMIGTVMDELAMILLTIPIFFPVVESLGFNPIWFGIIIIKVFELGAISPPVGMTIYVTYGMAKDVPLTVIFRGVVPFIISDICHTFLLIVFPQVALFLPDLMK